MKVFGTKGVVQTPEDVTAAERLQAIAARYRPAQPDIHVVDEREVASAGNNGEQS